MTSGILVEHDGDVAIVTIDREERMNALDDRAMRALADAFDDLATDDATKVVLVTARGERAWAPVGAIAASMSAASASIGSLGMVAPLSGLALEPRGCDAALSRA